MIEARDAFYALEAEYENRLPPMHEGVRSLHEKPFSESIEARTVLAGHGVRYYGRKAVEVLRAYPRKKDTVASLPSGDRIASKVIDEAEQARAEGVIAAFDAWQAECDTVAAEIGYTDASRLFDSATAELAYIAGEIAGANPKTLQGLAVQAEVSLSYPGPELRGLVHDVCDRLKAFAAVEKTDCAVVLETKADAEIANLFLRWTNAVLASVRACPPEGYDPNSPEHKRTRQQARDIRMELLQKRAKSLRGLLFKAMVVNGEQHLTPLFLEDMGRGVCTADTVARSITLDLIEMVNLLPHEWGSDADAVLSLRPTATQQVA
ncbi:hypothetical protein LGH83_04415 [Lichenihabitans sp. PAMC28606]|uniref:hypothetical protein n=1 Tax=Lichenihabitans sp. PAMC28606 TaxID=2880932 RepID=UPI001D0B35EE|nr:hypothetical protein [Lichenihabitans sp. PAMC28606]UDL95470.1 hypothetical protein LGH83_04415 [Lichenihabitans sp. PAMC28606]